MSEIVNAFFAHVGPQMVSDAEHFMQHAIEVGIVAGTAILIVTLVIGLVRRKRS